MSLTKSILALALSLGMVSAASAEEHLKSLNPNYFDNSIKPQEDFFNHVTKGWQEAHPLTPEFSRYGQPRSHKSGTRHSGIQGVDHL